MNSASQFSQHPYPRLRRFTIDLAITNVFNVVIAVVVTYVIRIYDSFFVNLVISVCIGTLMVTFIDGGRLLIWGIEMPPRLPFLLLLAPSVPAAQYLGHYLASWILDIPVEAFAAVRAKNTIGFAILLILSCLSITWFFWNRGMMAMLKAEAETEKARAAAIEKQALQAQLHMLQAQIEPHMLFNTLANLQALIEVDASRARQMLDQLIQYLRATLSSSRSEETTLAHEFSLMQAYLGLMSVRMGTRLSWTMDLPEELRDAGVPPMLLQPLIENAIKHGIEPKIEGGHIRVRATRKEQALELTIIDTGLGLDAAPVDQPGMGVGVANIRERLQALYGGRASFSLVPNTPSGVIAQLTIPSCPLSAL